MMVFVVVQGVGNLVMGCGSLCCIFKVLLSVGGMMPSFPEDFMANFGAFLDEAFLHWTPDGFACIAVGVFGRVGTRKKHGEIRVGCLSHAILCYEYCVHPVQSSTSYDWLLVSIRALWCLAQQQLRHPSGEVGTTRQQKPWRQYGGGSARYLCG